MKFSELVEKGYAMPNVVPFSTTSRGNTFVVGLDDVVYCCPVGAAALACGYKPTAVELFPYKAENAIASQFPEVIDWLRGDDGDKVGWTRKSRVLFLFDVSKWSIEAILSWIREREE